VVGVVVAVLVGATSDDWIAELIVSLLSLVWWMVKTAAQLAWRFPLIAAAPVRGTRGSRPWTPVALHESAQSLVTHDLVSADPCTALCKFVRITDSCLRLLVTVLETP
jgi:hypothetical protein